MSGNNTVSLPKHVYVGISFARQLIYITVTTKKNTQETHSLRVNFSKSSTIISWLRHYSKTHKTKIVAVCLQDCRFFNHITSRLWLELDISPFLCPFKSKDARLLSRKAARFASNQFNLTNSYHAKLDKNRKVITPPLASLSAYESISTPAEIKLLLSLSKSLNNKKIAFYSATPQGGGVALMRHSLMRILNFLGIKASWYVLKDNPAIYDITKKKIHNVLQNADSHNNVLDEHDKRLFNAWSKKNAQLLSKTFSSNDIFIVDDPQPSGLIPFIRRANPGAPIIYRSHIQLVARLADSSSTPQHISWDFIWQNIKSSDIFVSHPIKSFVPKNIPREKLVFMGATTDRLDGLNKELTDDQKRYYLRLFNKLLLSNSMTPLDHTRPFIVQIARFDPSKGIPDVLYSYKKLSVMLQSKNLDIPELVIIGNSSIDDPDGLPIYNMILSILALPEFKDIKGSIKVLRVPHCDQLLNAILRQSVIALQLSYKEGFEVKVTEALLKGKPVVAYKSGGIPLQLADGKSGFLVKTGDTQKVAETLYALLTERSLYQSTQINTQEYLRPEVSAIRNAINWLFLASSLIDDKSFSPNAVNITHLLKPHLQTP